MKRRFCILILALAMTLLCGCGAASNDGNPSGKGIFYTRAATDEEAFSQVLELQGGEEIDDEAVPMSGQPDEAEAPEEGWLLVRYAKNADGAVEPLWYRVWTADGVWSEEILPYEGTGWNPVLSAPVEVRPLG